MQKNEPGPSGKGAGKGPGSHPFTRMFHFTVTVAIILGCIEQIYLYTPALVNVKDQVSSWSSAGERNRPSALVTVCGSPSRFFHVTFAPTGTVIAMGEKSKFFITTFGLSAIPGAAVRNGHNSENASTDLRNITRTFQASVESVSDSGPEL